MVLTFVEELLLHSRFERPTKGVFADQFEVVGNVVHLLTLQISDYDEDVFASTIVHSSQEHQFWKLKVDGDLSGVKGKGTREKIAPL
jgi:hypothetical protein